MLEPGVYASHVVDVTARKHPHVACDVTIVVVVVVAVLVAIHTDNARESGLTSVKVVAETSDEFQL